MPTLTDQPPLQATYIGNHGQRKYRITNVVALGKYEITDDRGRVLKPVPASTLLNPEKFTIRHDHRLGGPA